MSNQFNNCRILFVGLYVLWLIYIYIPAACLYAYLDLIGIEAGFFSTLYVRWLDNWSGLFPSIIVHRLWSLNSLCFFTMSFFSKYFVYIRSVKVCAKSLVTVSKKNEPACWSREVQYCTLWLVYRCSALYRLIHLFFGIVFNCAIFLSPDPQIFY